MLRPVIAGFDPQSQYYKNEIDGRAMTGFYIVFPQLLTFN
jgi:hypothetical protein